MSFSYEALLKEPLPIKAAETSSPYHFFTERHLQALWLDQKYFRQLTTAEGETIEILSPGIWNGEAGPDFRKAHLLIGARELKGDVEIHLSCEDWVHHRHHQDQRYDQVVFHLSLWKPKKVKILETSQGKAIPQAFLEEALTIPLARIVQLIDLDLYPYRKFIGSGRCANALYRALPKEEIILLFQTAAEWRLKQKRFYLESREQGTEQQFVAGMAMALGYKNNGESFLELAKFLGSFSHCTEIQLLAICMGVSDFFREEYEKKWKSSRYYLELKREWQQLAASTQKKILLSLVQIRPLNHPIRRFAVLCKLVANKRGEQLFAELTDCWKNQWKRCFIKEALTKFRKELVEVIPSYEDGYWNHHYTFETEERKEWLPLLGEDLKEEILINAFFPLLQQKLQPHSQEEKAFARLYHSFPASKNSKSKYLAHRFFGDTIKGKLLHKASFEQGAFQLHRDFCLYFEASCEGCPFVERYQACFGSQASS